MDYALYMYYIDDEHNIHTQDANADEWIWKYQDTWDTVMAFCVSSEHFNIMMSTNLIVYFEHT